MASVIPSSIIARSILRQRGATTNLSRQLLGGVQHQQRILTAACSQLAAVPRIATAAPQHTNYFSTAALQVEEEPVVVEKKKKKKTKSKRRRTLQTKDPIIVTERAADRIKELLSGESAEGAIGIILGVKRRGCNGLSYTLNYAFEEPKDNGASMTAHGIQVFIEPMALFNVVGTTMDWEEDELTSEFTFNNPNSKGECGCGESFNV